MTRRGLLLAAATTPTVLLAVSNQPTIEKQLFALVNQEREKRGLSKLNWSDPLCQVARGHSGRMAENEFFAHQDPEVGDLRDRLQKANVAWQRCAENLFRERGYPSVVEPALSGWLQSPGHFANLIHPDYTTSGLGIAVSRSETVYVTQVFVKSE